MENVLDDAFTEKMDCKERRDGLYQRSLRRVHRGEKVERAYRRKIEDLYIIDAFSASGEPGHHLLSFASELRKNTLCLRVLLEEARRRKA